VFDIYCAFRIGLYKCAACGEKMQEYLMGGVIEQPCKCPEATCGKGMTMQLMHNLGTYNDKQLIKMQVCLDATVSLNLLLYMLALSSVLTTRCSYIHMCKAS